MHEPSQPGRWLSIVGIGEDGVAGLSPIARALLENAEVVFGGARHLALAAPVLRGAAHPWPSPFTVAPVLAARGRRAAVLASGDPFWFGVGATLLRHVAAAEVIAVPAPSAFALAASRLGWALQDAVALSLHGRPAALIRPHLQPGARLLALTSGADGPGEVAAMLAAEGFGDSRVTVLEALGGPREKIRGFRAADGPPATVDPLNLLAVEVAASPGARVLPLAPGLPDAWFEHDGQITKRAVRAATLSALAPRRGALLWDVGAGAGSVAIEWLLRDPAMRAVAIEARPDRAARVRRNAEALGVPGLAVVEGAAPGALGGLPAPDAIFLGGGATDPGVMDAAIAALRPGGRLVANAITLETEALILARRASLGGEMLRLAVSHAAPVAGMTGWRPAMPVTQWIWDKPWA